MNYKIIRNEKQLKGFIDWLPELEKHEKYFLALFARKKYSENKNISSDKSQLKRFVAHKGNMFDKIKQLECEIGNYKINGVEAPEESLALYINPNPRDMKKATYHMIKNCVDLLQSENNYNVQAEALSCIQRSKSKSHFCDFDVDIKSADVSKIKNILPPETYSLVETGGGYHILVKTRLAPKTRWHSDIKNTFDVDNIGDQLLPVPGCTQGAFIPVLIP